MQEHFFNCPHCWEEISVLLDPSVSNQNYVEDCGVCCNPIRLHVQFRNNELVSFAAEKEQ